MDTIKVYHTLRYFLTYFIGCAAFVALGIGLIHSQYEYLAQIAGWASVIFFGCGALVMITGFLQEQLLHKAYLVISDDSLKVNNLLKSREHSFSAIKSFNLYDMQIGKPSFLFKRQTMKHLSIAYRPEDEANSGYIPSIAVNGLTMKPQDLCDILNKKLKKE